MVWPGFFPLLSRQARHRTVCFLYPTALLSNPISSQNLSWGSCDMPCLVFSSTPRYVSVVERPYVFSYAMGTLSCLARPWNVSNRWTHSSGPDCPANKKSSKQCTTGYSLAARTTAQCNVVLKFSNAELDTAQPCENKIFFQKRNLKVWSPTDALAAVEKQTWYHT